jgi:MFS transporter, ACS family, hexuronate transporter
MATVQRGAKVWSLAVVATLGMTVSYVDRQTLAAIAPSVTSALQIDNTHFGWLLSAFSMAYLVAAPAAGVAVDRFGARRGFTAAVIVWSVVAAAHAYASSFATLFALRVLLGMAEAPSFPAAAQSIRRALPGAKRPLAFGLLFTGSSLGAILAAKLSVRLDTSYGYRAAFVGTAIVGLLWLPAWLLLSAGHGLDRGEPRVASDARWIDLVRRPAVLRAVVAIVGSAPALMFALNWTAKYFVEGWGIPKADLAGFLLPAPLAFDLGAVGFGAIATSRAHPDRVETPKALLLAAMGLASLLVVAPLATSAHGALLVIAASACGGGGIYALVTADALGRVPARHASAVSGMTASAQSIAHVCFGPLVGLTIDRTHGYGVALVCLGIAVVLPVLAFVLWPGMSAAAHAE